MNKIAFYDSKPYDEKSFTSRKNILRNTGISGAGAGAEELDFTFYKTRLNEKTAKLAAGFEIVCAFVNDQISSETADILYEGGVRLIVLRSAGYNNVDLKAVYGRIHVARVPAYSPYAIAEHAADLPHDKFRLDIKDERRCNDYQYRPRRADRYHSPG